MSYKAKPICRKFTLAASFVLVCLVSRSQYKFTELEKIFTQNQKVIGNKFVALVYKDGKIVYQKETEDFRARTKVKIDDCSQWITAALVMSFVDEGKISLDNRVSMYLPIFETYRKPDITIRQCLTHQTGIADNEKGVVKLLEMKRHKFETLEDEVNSFAKMEVAAAPGKSFNYGNMGLNIAGRVLEVVSKKKFDALVKQRIFYPLNMRTSSFTPEERSINPSTGAFSTAADYMNFMIMILDKGVFMGKRVLSEAAIKEMQTIQTSGTTKKYTPKGAEGFGYGLGEWIDDKSGNGMGSVVSWAAHPGSIAFIEKCRNYACLLFTNENIADFNSIYTQVKKAIDQQIVSSCN
ncbi:MAG: serine hydrolase domain-containing protein [Ferruginibacter sp.]